MMALCIDILLNSLVNLRYDIWKDIKAVSIEATVCSESSA